MMFDLFEVRHPKNKKIRRMFSATWKKGKNETHKSYKSSFSSPYRRASFRQRKALRSMRVRSMY